MFEREILSNLFLLQYAGRLLTDIPDERWAEQPIAGVNHPAWIAGHLALSGASAASLFGGEMSLDPKWSAMFGAGSQLSATRSEYPTKDELCQALDEAYQQARQAGEAATVEQAALPNTHPLLKQALPKREHAFAFLLTSHVAVHLGQLSAWRRMIGLPALF